MATARTTDEALRQVADGLARLEFDAAEASRRFAQVLRSLADDARRESTRRASQLRQARDALASSPEEEAARARAAVDQCASALAAAERAVTGLEHALQVHDQAARAYLPLVRDGVARGRAELARMGVQVDAYRAARLSGQSGSASGTAGLGSTATAGGGSGALSEVLARYGLQLVPLSSLTWDAVTSYDRGSPADYRFAAEKWLTTIAPALDAGGDLASISASDAGRPERRQLGPVATLFLDHPISVSATGAGTYDVGMGRHRCVAFQQLGFDDPLIPVRVLG